MNTISKILVAAAVLVSGISVAQETTDLTVTIGDSYNIVVNQATVGIDMTTPDHFVNGSTSGELANHLTVTASGAYTVEVIADGVNFLAGEGAADLIAVSNVEVEVTGQGVNNTSTASLTTVSLSNEEQTIISADGGDIAREYPVNYSIPSANAGNFLNKTNTTYTTTLTYSITPN